MVAFLDARTDDVPSEIVASVCIVGAGAAGITLARELSDDVEDVVLIESGGFGLEGDTQALFAGRQLGLPYFNLISCRLRYFGGTTNHWSGFCRANDPVDYEGREELDLPRWPINHTDLGPYIEKAGETLGVEALHFEPKKALEARGMDVAELAEDSSDSLLTKAFLFAPDLRLGPIFRENLETHPNVNGFTHLNLTHIQLTENGSDVDHLVCKTLTGKTVTVRAEKFVLCCHAIENARLLLASNDIAPEGIGNQYDHVGRYFMDHTHIYASRFVPTKSFPLLYNRDFAAEHHLNANLSFTDEFTRDAGLLQYYCRFKPVYYSDDVDDAISNVRAQAMEPGDLQFIRDVGTVTSELAGFSKAVLAKTGISYPLPDYYEMDHRLEQAPNPDSRVVLSEETDALGSRIADLDWRIRDSDVDSFKRGQEKVGQELAALGWGRVIEEDITRELVESRIAGHYHQIGTTRMSDAPEEGVVDANCKVHGVSNLYIGGSSVFPTAGYSGPTMMIIAFAMRLSDHLKEQLG